MQASRFFVAALLAAMVTGPTAQATPCETLIQINLPGVMVETAAQTAPFAANDPIFGPFSAKSAFCRVAGRIAPAIKFQVWLPMPNAWNGKLQGVGNGGVAGSIAEASLAAALDRGYAAVSSNLGHDGGPIDFSFAVGHPELVADWGYRATHEMTVAAKAIVSVYYGKPAAKAYFTGCSGGGRQGLMEAQRYPADYDGIVAGDPTADFTRLTLGGRLWEAIATLKDPARYIPAAKIPVIAAATRAACDGLDGIEDGVIDDPRRCRFNPVTIQCKSGDGDDCLTAPQVAALTAIYTGATDSKGKRIFPGYMPGGELGATGWAAYVTGAAPGKGSQFLYADGFVHGMVMENFVYNSIDFDYDRDMQPAIAKLSKTIDATDPDLTAFKSRNGRMIQYHGWADPGVSPMSSIDYYTRVSARMHDPSGFYRLFMAPGMQHCIGGPGPDHFDALSALEQWVEEGKAPDRIVATHMTTAGVIDRSRPLCPYPQAARWAGIGSTDRGENFACAAQ